MSGDKWTSVEYLGCLFLIIWVGAGAALVYRWGIDGATFYLVLAIFIHLGRDGRG